MISYGQGFVGFPDSAVYVQAAQHYSTIFGNRQPAGYPLFLRFIHMFSGQLGAPVLVQHVLGVATGVLLYGAIARTGAPPYLGLLPAAIVFFGGTGLLVEHSVLSDSIFTAMQAAALFAAIRALSDRRPRWPLLAGVAIGLSFWVRTAGITGIVLIPLVLLLGAPGDKRRRLAAAGAAMLTATVLIAAYVGTQGYLTGFWGYEQQGAWNLYGRVATFVDCTRFTPPRGTAFVCPREPLSKRRHQSFFQYSKKSPAVQHYGPPAVAPRRANGVLQRFSVAAIEHQPIDYANAILHTLTYFISPRVGEGYTPGQLREQLRSAPRPAISKHFSDVPAAGNKGNGNLLRTYESNTRIQGTLLVVLLLAAIIGAPLLSGRVRWAAILCTSTAIVSAVFAAAGNRYDARYAYPAFGPLAAGAALGAWGIATFIKRRPWQRRIRAVRRPATPA
jgi:Dolichyl-phosphate-mannose-protein mannosyltransferase